MVRVRVTFQFHPFFTHPRGLEPNPDELTLTDNHSHIFTPHSKEKKGGKKGFTNNLFVSNTPGS